ncbi:very-short-patch-repair endonuclease [Neisseria perflava]|uniref:endonuclease domain-containing protein n=1 Tax=Neisseria perflava TaxID=33053 RepID=UPI00209D2A97|nr:endonuclease domain-containing protein [Neisseria perflava]MCP1771446.1 very-short-patch-repair endonuclease [Neisseria perflava]
MADKLFAHDNPLLLQPAKNMRREMTEAERVLWFHLRANRLGGYKFRRQQPLGAYIADFVCTRPKLIIEADGGQHTEQTAYDNTRSKWFEAQGFTVLRFWNHEILQQTAAVLEQIFQTLQALSKKES